ncbi:hypothetical protein BHM03_00013620 [Ensete ventricosum]|nr:hypothetical protein BHM03_00013620 [Ensete ventricosum]
MTVRVRTRRGVFFLMVVVISSATLITPSLSDPRTSQAALICTNHTASAAARSSFVANFLSAMDAVTPQIAAQEYARVVVTGGSSPVNASAVYAFGQCMKDLSKADCDMCFATCKTQILKCLPFQKATRGGRNFLDGCYLRWKKGKQRISGYSDTRIWITCNYCRYDEYEFFGEALSQDDRVICSDQEFAGNTTAFTENTKNLVKKLSTEAPRNDGFLVASVEAGNSSVYGLGQCWEFVNKSSCDKCLLNARKTINSCIPKQEGRVLNSGCYMRYSISRFYNNSGTDAAGGGELDLFTKDKTHISTGIAGTLTYGSCWEFKTRAFYQPMATYYLYWQKILNPVITQVWNLYTSNRLLEAIDPILEGNFPMEKATRVLQIGLLCAQASAELRPAISVVVKMLVDDSPIPSPTQPPFLNSSMQIALAAQMKANSRHGTSTQSSDNNTTITVIEPR